MTAAPTVGLGNGQGWPQRDHLGVLSDPTDTQWITRATGPMTGEAAPETRPVVGSPRATVAGWDGWTIRAEGFGARESLCGMHDDIAATRVLQMEQEAWAPSDPTLTRIPGRGDDGMGGGFCG